MPEAAMSDSAGESDSAGVSGGGGVSGSSVTLRPVTEDDLALLARFANEPAFSLPFEWAGFGSSEASRRRWEQDGFLGADPRQLTVAGVGGSGLGWVTWRDPHLFGRAGWTWEIGILLAPEHRGRGVGTAAQRLLAEYLFETTLVHRLAANTEADNIAEHRSLERCGFRREGLLRQAGFRGGRWRDVVVYALLKGDAEDAG
jgi:ribosomal-protein-alanine N-acetyltransferase